MKDRSAKQNDTNYYLMWAHWILYCYPRAWRDRYTDEMELVLQHHPITLWTLIDLFLGALDARLHSDLLPRRITSMAYRIRNSEIVIFCAFIVYGVAWFAVRFIRDPLSIWESTVQVHPEILLALNAVDVAGLMALLAIVVSGLPILYVVLRNALRSRRWKVLGLLAMPPIAIAGLVLYALLISAASTQRAPDGTPEAPFTPLAIVLQLSLVLLLCAAIGGSTAAVALAVSRSHFSNRLLRFALIPATVVTLGIAAGLLATIILTVLTFTEAPQLASPGTTPVIILMMVVAALLAINALQRGVRAAREEAASAEGHV